jgi:hypothetical protein
LEKREGQSTRKISKKIRVFLQSSPGRFSAVIDLQRYLLKGRLSALQAPHPIQVEGRTVLLPAIILGERLAAQLGVFEGSPVQVVSPLGSATAIGIIPKVRRCRRVIHRLFSRQHLPLASSGKIGPGGNHSV